MTHDDMLAARVTAHKCIGQLAQATQLILDRLRDVEAHVAAQQAEGAVRKAQGR